MKRGRPVQPRVFQEKVFGVEKQFREGARYSGEIVYGACSGSGANIVTILKRNGNSVTYRFGKTEGGLAGEAIIETLENWGEYIAVGEDRFFALAIEPA